MKGPVVGIFRWMKCRSLLFRFIKISCIMEKRYAIAPTKIIHWMWQSY